MQHDFLSHFKDHSEFSQSKQCDEAFKDILKVVTSHMTLLYHNLLCMFTLNSGGLSAPLQKALKTDDS